MSLLWWVTRPQPQADEWAQALQAQGIGAHALPLLQIGPAPDLAAVEAQVQAIGSGGVDAVMFVSANAAQGLLHGRPELAAQFGPRMRAWTAGPGTAKALCELGVSASAVDQPAASAAQFDSEALWQIVQPRVQAGLRAGAYRVAFMRGAEANGQVAGRDWLSDMLQALGVRVSQVAVYARQQPPQLRQTLVNRALGQSAGWLFSSSHALQHLQHAAPDVDWRPHRALCTHERIAHTAQQMGFEAIRLCRPRLSEVCESIKSWA